MAAVVALAPDATATTTATATATAATAATATTATATAATAAATATAATAGRGRRGVDRLALRPGASGQHSRGPVRHGNTAFTLRLVETPNRIRSAAQRGALRGG